jgi:hypothetical protein
MHIGFYVISTNKMVALVVRLSDKKRAPQVIARASSQNTKLLHNESMVPVMLKELFPQTYLRGTAHSVALEQPYKVMG